MKLDIVKPEEEIGEITLDKQDTPVKIDREYQAEIIDKCLMGEPVEKTVMIKKIKVVLRSPSVEIVNAIYLDVAKAAQDNYVNMQVESSATMIGAYVREYNGYDFAKELGDEYDTIEGKKKVRKHLDRTLIEAVRDVLSDEVRKFYEEVKAAFTDDALDFS